MIDGFVRNMLAPIVDRMGGSKEMNNILTSDFLPELQKQMESPTLSAVSMGRFVEQQLKKTFVYD